MLKVTIPETEYFDEAKQEFVSTRETTLQLEHSLVSISKWESKWKIPFLGKDKKTAEQTLDYIRCMTITQNVNPLVYNAIPPSVLDEIDAYLEDSKTATWFSNREPKGSSREIITSEVIYYWMLSQQIPLECEKWHLNRLLTLIRVFNEKNNPGKKMSRKDILSQNYALNAMRKQKMNTHG